MQLRTGVDLIEINRIRRAISRNGERFLARIYTPRERRQVEGDFSALASRFAGKEAVAKALGTGIGAVSWQEIEILRKPSREPEIFLHGAAQKLAASIGINTWSISLTHSRDHAIAFCVGISSHN